MQAVMGQTMKKMRQRIDEKPSSNELESKIHEFDEDSDSADWVTEIPTRSSSFFSDLTGNSTTDTGTTGSSFTSGTEYTSQEMTTNTADVTETVPSKKKPKKSRIITSTSSWSSNTSADHPPLERLEDSDVELNRHRRSDEIWQLKVNQFLQHDPIYPRIRKPKRAKYVIKRHHLYIDPEAGKRWRDQIIRFIARIPPKISNIIPITESDA